jgi:hypothetical protein
MGLCLIKPKSCFKTLFTGRLRGYSRDHYWVKTNRIF